MVDTEPYALLNTILSVATIVYLWHELGELKTKVAVIDTKLSDHLIDAVDEKPRALARRSNAVGR